MQNDTLNNDVGKQKRELELENAVKMLERRVAEPRKKVKKKLREINLRKILKWRTQT